MRKLSYLLLLLPALFMAGCGDKGDSQIEIHNSSEQTLTAGAGDQSPGGFTFTAKADWTATVAESDGTRSPSVPWLRLLLDGKEQYGGGAGTFRLTVELDPNTGKEARSATIVVTSGGDSIRITVTQQGTGGGDDPDPEPGEYPIDKYERFVSRIDVEDEDSDTSVCTFDYDEKGRVTAFVLSGVMEATVSYSGPRTINIDIKDLGDYPEDGMQTLTLNDDGTVSSAERRGETLVSFKYDAGGYIESCLWDDYRSKDTYVWQNGNLVSLTAGSDVENYTYSDYPNNAKVNLDLNPPAVDLYQLFGWAGRRSRNYLSTGACWFKDDYSAESTPEYSTAVETVWHPAVYEFDAQGYLSKVVYSWTDKWVKTYHATGEREILSEENGTETLRITYRE